MPPDTDAIHLKRAIGLAMKARGRVEPNPMVGCVLADAQGALIGQGIHEQFGQAHAEPNALADCIHRGHRPAGATAYVTLEPCCHTDKKTPPCAPRLIAAGVSRVVVGCLDPNPKVNGLGVAMLQNAGIVVDQPPGELRLECLQLIAPFVRRTCSQRPYVTLKWAQTADSKVAGAAGSRLKISNDASDAIVHGLRSRSDAIVVGVNTMLNDDPMLNVRGIDVDRQPDRWVLDSRLRTPLGSKLVASAREQGVVIVCGSGAFYESVSKRMQLEAAGVRVVEADDDDVGVRPADVLKLLGNAGYTHVLVEPGPTLAKRWLQDDVADRVWVIRSPVSTQIDSCLQAPHVPAHFVQTGQLDVERDTLIEYLNPDRPEYFAPHASADFELASIR